ncbi:Deoxyhypusine synthase [Seminavis robusta]|uniref:deoxyhypusine synthase n=1 Tax=Seminavis robusta TaxID=568900 RepID=A0A9N8DD15_9STRA|nr:Deoxyhypusine synthase [Seminavis robusta]|eukprot:Sro40_g024530.1 Deoxyhypusine synthase (451) ;mRNA; f:29055-30480
MSTSNKEPIASSGALLEGDTVDRTILKAAPLAKDNPVSANPHIPSVSASAVLGESSTMPEGSTQCRGFDFNSTLNNTSKDVLEGLLKAFTTTGFQASNVGLAVEQIRRMRQWRLSDTEWKEGDDEALKPIEVRQRIRARIFLGYTSNQISCGQREVIKFLVQHKMVDVLVTTAGGIEEDIIKCFEPTFMGDFKLNGRELRKKGINRIGNLLVPNKNYCDFEDWMSPLIDSMHDYQDQQWKEWAQKKQSANNNGDDDDDNTPPFVWTPSKVIRKMGLAINNPDSVLYWAAKHNIPVFSPALTDGSVGDMLYFHSYKRPGFILDTNHDIRAMNDLAVQSHHTGMIILGGGLVKHHICNANLMRNGANFAVFINTGQEYDGSDSGASPDEALSWGKIAITAQPVKVCCDASIAFPLIVSQTFAKNVDEWKEQTKDTVCWIDDLDSTTSTTTTS